MPKVLFVYIGPHLKGQKNKKLADIIENKHNIIEFGPISSYEIYSYLELFDIFIFWENRARDLINFILMDSK